MQTCNYAVNSLAFQQAHEYWLVSFLKINQPELKVKDEFF
jgi:hypothetical protein